MRSTRPLLLACCILAVATFTHGQAAPQVAKASPPPAAAAAPANTTPTLTDSQRIEILVLANQKHLLQEQMDQAQIDLLQQQIKAQTSYISAAQNKKAVELQIDGATAKIMGFDKTKFALDSDTGTVKALNPPATK